MIISETLFDDLEKKALNNLPLSDENQLAENFTDDEIEELSEVIQQLNKPEKSIPNNVIKERLKTKYAQSQVQTANRTFRSTSTKRNYRLKSAAIIISLICLGSLLILSYQQNNDAQLTEIEQHLKNMEVNSTVNADANQPKTVLKEETKYLMTLDFFSNSSLTRSE